MEMDTIHVRVETLRYNLPLALYCGHTKHAIEEQVEKTLHRSQVGPKSGRVAAFS